jgi:hypothetical protein
MDGLTMFFGVVAYVLAAQINPAVRDSGWVSREIVVRITGPITEEFLKALILIYLVQRADFNYVVDGALYGFGAGIGFAVIENYEYVLGYSDVAIMVAVGRVFSTNLVHAVGTGVIGTALAYHRGDHSLRGKGVILLGYGFAMGMHILFNTMVNIGVALLVAILYGFLGVLLIWQVIKRGMNIQKEWVGEKLGMGDRVTSSEAKVVTNIDDLDEVLTPIKNQFGEEKVKIVKELISTQAEIGIKRKLMEMTPNESKKQEIGEIIAGLGRDMDALRRQAGSYCMMFVRTVYLEQNIKTFDLLKSRVAVTNPDEEKKPDAGLFGRATSRIKRPVIERDPPQEDKP